MLGSRFLWKLILGAAGLILVTTAIVGLLTYRQIERDTLDEVEQRLSEEAYLLRDLAGVEVFHSPPSDLQERVRAIGRNTRTRLTLIRADGVVLADSAREPAELDNHGGRPEVIEAQSEDIGKATRYSASTGETRMYVCLPSRQRRTAPAQGGEAAAESELVGFVRTSIPLTLLETRRFQLQMGLLSGAAIAALLGLALTFPLARRMTRPLYSMTTVAESMAKGDYEQRVPVDSEDEMGTLARTFNHMAGELEERIHTIDRDRHQLLAILGSMVEGVVALDPEERVVHMNRAAGNFLRADPATSAGANIWELIRVPAIGQALQAAMAGGVNSGEARIAAEADDRILELHAAPLRHSGGAVLVLYDVTDLRRLEAMRRDFVANVSHELKTPVTAILGIIETILDDPDMGVATTEKFLNKISDNSRRLASLVSDLLTLSRLESGDRFLEHRILDLRRPLEEALRSQTVHADQKQVALEADLPEDEVPVRGDHEALREAIENLLSNAVRYSPPSGKVQITLALRGPEAEISVTDSGPGIEPKHQERIFERFYRIDRARSRELGGTGLGLSIVKHISLSHGGSVAVESEPGEGSSFRIRLPLAR